MTDISMLPPRFPHREIPKPAPSTEPRPAPAAPERSHWKGRDLGSITHGFNDRHRSVRETDYLVGTGELYGLVNGFPKLDDALLAAQAASKGEKPAVAVFSGPDSNYHLRGLRYLSVWESAPTRPGATSDGHYKLPQHRMRPYHLERHLAGVDRDGSSVYVEPGVKRAPHALQAIVDGGVVQHAHAPKAEPARALAAAPAVPAPAGDGETPPPKIGRWY